MFWIQLLILACIGALIGWLTNIIAIKLIFRPLKPINIPVFNIKIQGLIPKRRNEIAVSVGKIVEEELVSAEEIIDKFIEQNNRKELISNIKNKINKLVNKNMPSFIPFIFKDKIIEFVNDIIDKEAEKIVIEITEEVIHKATNKVKLSEIIEEKINNFELEKLEKIILKIAKQELKHIEILGGFIGFFIGVVQGLIIFAID